MKEFAAKRPIIFEIMLIVVAFALAFVLSAACQILGSANSDFNISVARILVALLLIAIFHSCFDWKRQFSGALIALPALLFVAWNIANHYLSHGAFAALSAEIVILGIAPALFEEVLFRGIFIHNLKASGKSDMFALLVSAAIFGLIHLTNAMNGDLLNALVQTGYSTVVGLVFGAVYIKSGDLASLIVIHAAIDITNRVFMGATSSPTIAVAIFIALLVVEIAYALLIVSRRPKKADNAD